MRGLSTAGSPHEEWDAAHGSERLDFPDPAPAGGGSLWQLAVEPSPRGTGLGRRLLAPAESRIVALGSTQVVIDTSSQATDLVDRYCRRGYAPVGTWRWDVTKYDSVVLMKNLPPTTS
ncbi:GNAT superfamily N-acetyltransferase [Streptomyces sp. 3330]|uniref:GNAT family N-acetyltransferase n=1 Tax=Streptomyces sp. 3330 TaxID=2817755 RepID=UPI00285DA73B|nr:GNAT family N-acetyltransferase [Streptomyces sp. 3330]MDR6979721.1 GNAT superfamily N-acetyltransferase [Streptomyces sp. 3330]